MGSLLLCRTRQIGRPFSSAAQIGIQRRLLRSAARNERTNGLTYGRNPARLGTSVGGGRLLIGDLFENLLWNCAAPIGPATLDGQSVEAQPLVEFLGGRGWGDPESYRKGIPKAAVDTCGFRPPLKLAVAAHESLVERLHQVIGIQSS